MNRTALRSQARDLMKSSTPKPLYVSIVYVLILMLLSLLSYELFGKYIAAFIQSMSQSFNFSDPTKLNDSLNGFITSIDPENLRYELQNALPSTASSLLNILLTATGILVSTGFIIFCMNTVSGNSPDFGNLFDGFAMFLRVLWLFIVEAVFIFMWSMLFFFPGIIAFYRYRMAIYLLIDHPEMGVMRCIAESSRMMNGHKGELFGLDLSFIGWFILVYVLNVLGASTGIPLLGILGLGYLAYIPLLPYLNICWVLFYRQLAENSAPFDYDFPETEF